MAACFLRKPIIATQKPPKARGESASLADLHLTLQNVSDYWYQTSIRQNMSLPLHLKIENLSLELITSHFCCATALVVCMQAGKLSNLLKKQDMVLTKLSCSVFSLPACLFHHWQFSKESIPCFLLSPITPISPRRAIRSLPSRRVCPTSEWAPATGSSSTCP